VYAVADVPGEARAATFRQLCRHRGVAPAAVEAVLYTHADGDAVRHVFRVASSLDSMMIGEPQILGQVKDAFALAQSCEAVGPALHTLFTQAFAVAKKVRTETEIARHAVSVSFAAVELAKKIFAGLDGKAVLLVGAGKMSELAARHLVEQGAFPLYVANRTWARAQEMARALAGTAVPFDELATALATVDIVIASTGAPEPVIRRDTVQRVINGRRGRPLFFIDIAVPRDVDPKVNEVDNVYLYDIDDLQGVVQAGLDERRKEMTVAEAIVERETEAFLAWMKSLEVTPTIVDLRRHLHGIADQEVERFRGKVSGLTPGQEEAVRQMAASLVNKLLHAPTLALKRLATQNGAGKGVMLIREIFGIDRPEEAPTEDTPREKESPEGTTGAPTRRETR